MCGESCDDDFLRFLSFHATKLAKTDSMESDTVNDMPVKLTKLKIMLRISSTVTTITLFFVDSAKAKIPIQAVTAIAKDMKMAA